MKYLDKTFTHSYGSKKYKDGWERIFGKKTKKEKCLCILKVGKKKCPIHKDK